MVEPQETKVSKKLKPPYKTKFIWGLVFIFFEISHIYRISSERNIVIHSAE